MHITSICLRGRYLSLRRRWCRFVVLFVVSFSFIASVLAQEAQQSRDAGIPIRLPRQQAQTSAALDGIVRSSLAGGSQVPVAGATLSLRNISSNLTTESSTNAEGVFRIFPVVPGDYYLSVQANGYAAFVLEKLAFHANEVVTLEVSLTAIPSSELRPACRDFRNWANRFLLKPLHGPATIANRSED